jgi:predicted TIM-barrel fold metal-dependent hydrolase
MHVGRLYHFETKPLTPSYLLKFMDANCIEKAALLPIESPEETDYYVTTDYVLNVCKRHPDRFIPFCNMDPRRRSADLTTDFRGILTEYRDRGCRGLGELMAGVYVDDPRMQAIYEVCGELGMPIVFHLDALRDIDEVGLPRYEAMIRKFPKTIFVGHGPHFWAEISADMREEDIGGYPKGKVAAPGAVEKLLSTYSNAYADLSAGSGYNAITRDPDYGGRFLDRFQDKLLFGTDICRRNMTFPMIDHLAGCGLSKAAYGKITSGNAWRLLGL